MSVIEAMEIPSEAGISPILIDADGKVVMPKLNDLIHRRNERDVEVFE